MTSSKEMLTSAVGFLVRFRMQQDWSEENAPGIDHISI